MKQLKMPVVFAGHGYPMNAITDNPARIGWARIGKHIIETYGKPKAIAAITSHWETCGVSVRVKDKNPQIFDILDLPEEIYDFHYEPVNSPETAHRILELINEAGSTCQDDIKWPEAFPDNTWGIDHALWTTLGNMFPGGDIPVVPVSVDFETTPEKSFKLGQILAPLRDEGVLLFATGNIVHNVEIVDHSMIMQGYDWAQPYDDMIKGLMGRFCPREDQMCRDWYAETCGSNQTDACERAEACGADQTGSGERAEALRSLLNIEDLKDTALAIPTFEHYYPLLTIMGATDDDDRLTIFNDYVELGSLSMTSYYFERK